MDVAGITLGVLWHARFQALFVESMTEIAFERASRHLLGFHLASHLFWIRVVTMGEPLEPELSKASWEFDHRSLGRRGLVAHHTHFAVWVREVFGVAFDAGRVSRKDGPRIIARTLMAGATVLCFRLVLFAVVIEKRDHLNHFRINHVKRRLIYRRRPRRVL